MNGNKVFKMLNQILKEELNKWIKVTKKKMKIMIKVQQDIKSKIKNNKRQNNSLNM